MSKPTDAPTPDHPVMPPLGDETSFPPAPPVMAPMVEEPAPVQDIPEPSRPPGPDAEDAALIRAADAPLPQPVRRRSGLLGTVLGGILAAGAGFGLAQYVPGGWPIADTSQLEARLAAAEAAVQDMQARMAEVAATPAPTDPALIDRITALENAPVPAQSPDLTARLDSVEQQVAAIAALPAPTGGGAGIAPAALAALQADITALKAAQTNAPAAITAETEQALARLSEAETRAISVADSAAATIEAATTRAALIQIRAAIDAGEPYVGALSALPSDPPPALATFAETGLSSLPALQATFPDAARAALEAALRADMGDSWTARMGSFLRNQTGARSLTPREGTDPDAILSRAEAALTVGDLPAAMAEIAALPPESLTAMQLWTTQAQQRLDAQAALTDLTNTLGQ